MEIEIAEYSGYCFGVRRALELVKKSLVREERGSKKVYTLGSIIHNPGVVHELRESGLISVEKMSDIEKGSVFIVRSHGISPHIMEELEKKDIKIIDATCPFVKKAHSRTRKLAEDGYHVIVIGDKGHPEVRGIRDQVDREGIDVVSNSRDLAGIGFKKKMGVVIQTTQTMKKLKELACLLLDKTGELDVINTICDTTRKRQDAVRELSGKVDVMLVVGGRNSANTSHLADISMEQNPNTFHIENSSEIKEEWFSNAAKVGICGGASTPEEDIFEIKGKIRNMRS